MTGTLECAANVSTSACAKVLIMTMSTIEEITFAVSAIGSPRPSCVSWPDRNSALPPSWDMPASKETRVRVEALVKIIAKTLPCNVAWDSPRSRSALSSMARRIRRRISSALKSMRVKKCRGAVMRGLPALQCGSVCWQCRRPAPPLVRCS